MPLRTLAVSGASSLTVAYGGDWQFVLDPAHAYCGAGTATISENGKTLSTTQYFANQGQVYMSSWAQAPLVVGTHKLTLALTTELCGAQEVPATVTVQKAAMSVDGRLTADPNAPQNAIITMLAVGDFVDKLTPTYLLSPDDAVSARFPAGTWNMSIADADGKVVHEMSVTTKYGDDPWATGYWAATPPDAQLTATATFTPSGTTGGNFAMAKPTPLSYSTAQETNPGLSKPADDGPPATAAPTGFTLPLWALVAGAVLAAGALALGIVALVRLVGRQRRLDTLLAPLGKDAVDARA
jgi:hypothetical protein